MHFWSGFQAIIQKPDLTESFQVKIPYQNWTQLSGYQMPFAIRIIWEPNMFGLVWWYSDHYCTVTTWILDTWIPDSSEYRIITVYPFRSFFRYGLLYLSCFLLLQFIILLQLACLGSVHLSFSSSVCVYILATISHTYQFSLSLSLPSLSFFYLFLYFYYLFLYFFYLSHTHTNLFLSLSHTWSHFFLFKHNETTLWLILSRKHLWFNWLLQLVFHLCKAKEGRSYFYNAKWTLLYPLSLFAYYLPHW